MAVFKGAGVAIATPFGEGGAVDYEEFDRLIEFQIENETDSIIVCGTTGESATMTEAEHMEVVRHCIKTVNGRVPVIAGAGSNCTKTAVKLSKEAQDLGADAVLSVTPYYNKATQEGLFRHYSAISDAVDIPIILYNVPTRTGTTIAPETVARLYKEVEHVVGIKDAGGSLPATLRALNLAGEGLEVYSGDDDVIVPIISLGGFGVISVLSNIAPRETHDMCRMALEGDYKGAAKIQIKAEPLIKALFSEVSPIPVKKALSYMGYKSTNLRLPLVEMSEEAAKILKKEMQEFGII